MEKKTFICEVCGRSTDIPYGSGKYCSNECFHKSERFQKHLNKIHEAKRAPYGTWTCRICGKIFESRSLLTQHRHNDHKLYGVWNKGLTKETSPIMQRISETLKEHYRNGSIPDYPRKHWTEEERKRISEKMKAYLKANPEKHTWKKIKANQSVPCEEFKKFLKLNDVNFFPEFTDENWSHSYSIDIAFPNDKVGIEINGNQHYTKDGNLEPYTKFRHEYLESQGWMIIEVPYYMAYNEELRQCILTEIKEKTKFSFDYSKMIADYTAKIMQKKAEGTVCPKCGNKKCKSSKLCLNCHNKELKRLNAKQSK